MFVDLLKVKVKAGDGGNGLVGFRREKYVERGGPDGGNGGNGGSVVFEADKNEYDLAEFNFLKLIKADDGQAGGGSNKKGRSGRDIIVRVPLGTLILDDETEEIVADLVDHRQQVVAATGGEGGFGNAHFKSSTNRTPLVAEKGLKGQVRTLRCELKLLAEAGLVGLPNAGKSTFLRAVTKARPKVGAYPFTTLEPHLGVSRNGCLIADIPGLIAGAAEGKGLGHQFLRHVERSLVILHLVDCQGDGLIADYQQISDELEAYNPELLKRPRLLVLTKVEMLEPKILKQRQDQLRKKIAKDIKIYAISSLANLNLDLLLKDLKKAISGARAELRVAEAAQLERPGAVVFSLKNDGSEFLVEQNGGRFVIHGTKIEIFALKTDFDNFHARQRLLDIMFKMGITKQLLAASYEDEPIVFGKEGVGVLHLNEEMQPD